MKKSYTKSLFIFVCLMIILASFLAGCQTGEIAVDTSNVELSVCKGYDFDYSQLEVYIIKGETKTEVALSDVVLLGLNTDIVGVQTVSVKYKASIANFEVTVIDADIVEFFDGEGLIGKQIVYSGEKVSEILRETTEELYFDGWYDGDTKFDFDTQIDKYTTLTAKYLTVSEYAAKIEAEMEKEFSDWLAPSQKNVYFAADFAVLKNAFSSAVEGLDTCTTISQLEQTVPAMLSLLDKVPTAVDRIVEYEREIATKIEGLNSILRNQIRGYISAAKQEIEQYAGGAPTPEYIFYQLKTRIEMYTENHTVPIS